MSSTRWSAGTSTKTSSHTNTKTHSNTRNYRTQYTNLKHTRAHVPSLFGINSVFQDDIAFSRNHAASTTNEPTHTNTTTAPLPLTRCAVLRHKREPSSVATTTFYSRAWVLRGRLIIVALLILFLQNRLQGKNVTIKQQQLTSNFSCDWCFFYDYEP